MHHNFLHTYFASFIITGFDWTEINTYIQKLLSREFLKFKFLNLYYALFSKIDVMFDFYFIKSILVFRTTPCIQWPIRLLSFKHSKFVFCLKYIFHTVEIHLQAKYCLWNYTKRDNLASKKKKFFTAEKTFHKQRCVILNANRKSSSKT